MKQNTKFVLGTFFKSLVNNDAAIEGGKKAPWWMSLILFVLSIGLPLIPIAVNANNVKGSSYLGASALSLNTHLTATSLQLKSENKEFEIKNGECIYKVAGVQNDRYEDTEALEPIATYESTREEIRKNPDTGEIEQTTNILNQIEFEVYYTARNFSSKDELTVKSMVESLAKRDFVYGTKNLKSDADDATTKYYKPSFMVVYKTGLYIVNYVQDSSLVSGYTQFNSDWKHTKDCNLIERVLTVKDMADSAKKYTNTTYVAEVYKNWQKVVDESYLNAKVTNIGWQMLIYGGVYAGIIIIMGFMLWLLTRGKSNPFNYLTYWTNTKISCWASLAPSILGMIGGFIFAQYAGFVFIIFEGLRMMWLAMKNLRPAY